MRDPSPEIPPPDELLRRALRLPPAKRARFQELLRRKIEPADALERIPSRHEPGPAPLSFSQQRLWLLHQLDPESAAYNLPGAVGLAGALDEAALRRAVAALVDRHEILRTRFEVHAGVPVQRVVPAAELQAAGAPLLPRVDLDALEPGSRRRELYRLAAGNARTRFDLARGALIRAVLIRLAGDDHALLYTMHHIVSDAWSMAIFVRELAAFYDPSRPRPPALAIQYPDYAVWQRRQLTGERLARELGYWRRRIGDDPAILELPADRPRSTARGARGGRRLQSLPPGLGPRLEGFARGRGATLFMVLLAAFQALLGRFTASRRVLVGSPVANRQRAEVEPLIGFFVNTLIHGADLSADPTFGELLAQVRGAALDAFDHQELPFEKLVEELQPERDLGHMPLVQVLLVHQNQPREALELPGVRLRPLPVESGAATFDLVLAAIEGAAGLLLQADFRRDLFDRSTIDRLLGRFRSLLEAALERPDAALSELAAAPAGERHQVLVEWNDSASSFAAERAGGLGGGTLSELFAATAARFPRRTALSLDDERLSYRRLARRAERLAGQLRARGVGPESRVAIAMERSFEMVVAILGVLDAGGAYLPLDPAAPPERLAWVLRDSRAALVLTRPREARRLGELGVTTLAVDARGALGAGETSAPPAAGDAGTRPADPENLAYLIYTSGSSGRPKGVMIPHSGVVNTLLWRLSTFGLRPDDVILQNIAFTFDPSLWQIFGALLSGARLDLVPTGGEQDFSYLARRVAEEKVTITDLSPSMLRVFLDQPEVASCRHLRLLFAGGEALPAALAERFLRTLEAADLRNIYGPTEASIDAACWRFRPEAGAGPVAIGRPVANKQLLVLDRRLDPVPLGVPGELVIGGAGLARGYAGRAGRTAAAFLPDRRGRRPGARVYRTGDLVRLRPDGAVEFLGRIDRQVKVRGFRIELGEVEAALRRHPSIREAAALARPLATGDTRLEGYVVADRELAEHELRDFLRRRLPAYMVPAILTPIAEMPHTASGKIDYRALPEPTEAPPELRAAPQSELERAIAAIWRSVLDRRQVGIDDNFFDLGGHSLLLMRVHGQLRETLGRDLPVVDLFNYPTVRSLARHLDPASGDGGGLVRARRRAAEQAAALAGGTPEVEAVAIVAMAGRFPGSAGVEELWQNLRRGVEGISSLTDDELRAAGVPAGMMANPEYVRAAGVLDGAELFDADFFDLSPREAEVLDPQQRVFLEVCWQALEEAGYDPQRYDGAIGVYAGVSANTYLLNNLLANPAFLAAVGADQATLGSDKDFLATRVSYKLDLQGPSLTVQTACSTSLVAVHLAARALLDRQCDMALAGGASITVPQKRGYLYQQGSINSPDGHCRAFDADARGTVGGNGVGVVVLKRLSEALRDGDPIRAVLRATAINNDGAFKVGFTAPSVDGQAQVIATALTIAGLEARDLGYVEAHGTGTPLGDPIEIAALNKVFGGDPEQRCEIGSLKSNVGHLDAAAGVAGLIKAALVVERGRIPASLHFRRPNPRIDFDRGPFRVSTEDHPWPSRATPRRAGVSSFGIGGTNAHAILEEPPPRPAPAPSRPWQLLVLSARSPTALEEAGERLAGHLESATDQALPDQAYTLMAGRRAFEHRLTLVCRGPADAAEILRSRDPRRLHTAVATPSEPRVAFLFPGQGAQHAGMLRGLYDGETIVREIVDRAAGLLAEPLGHDLRELLFPPPERAEEAGRRLAETAVAQPALFVAEYALARVWMGWGVPPAAALGHSLGEYVAACLAGVFDFEDALALVAVRGRLMQGLPPGAMLSVSAGAGALAADLGPELALAAVNGPGRAVVSGPAAAIEALAVTLGRRGIVHRRLHTSHAFHSPMMEPILAELAREVEKLRPRPPALPFVSNLTGTWITAGEATDPAYWARHARETVRFADGVATLLEDPDVALLEVGPGRTLAGLARRVAGGAGKTPATVSSARPPQAGDDDQAVLLEGLGKLWAAGVAIDPAGFWEGETRRRVALPTYPFERRRYWIEPDPAAARGLPRPAGKSADPADWFYQPIWRETPSRAGAAGAGPWLVFLDRHGLGEALAHRLEEDGRQVIAVAAGEAFEAGEKRFTLRPGRLEDHRELLRALAGRGALPRGAVHLWNVTREEAEDPEELLAASFYSLLHLARALTLAGLEPEAAGAGTDGDEPGPAALELWVISNGLHDVGGSEALEPLKAPLLGPVRAIPRELPGVYCKSVDVVLPEAGGASWRRLVEQLETELAGIGHDPPVVALRGAHRFVQDFEAVPLAAAGEPVFRSGEVYLITGGLGGVGLALARGIAEEVPARLALVGRTALPPRPQWPQHAGDPRVEAVRDLESRGAEVLTFAADVGDAAAMRAVLAETRRAFGPVRGVIHAAGVPGDGLIAFKEAADAARVLAPKIHGTRVLGELLAAEELEFFVLCSSLASLLGGVGQVDYAAANAFLDAFAVAQAAAGGLPARAIQWDAWRRVGMAVRAAADHGGEAPAYGLEPAEGVDVLRRVLAGRRPTTVVSTLDFHALVRREREARAGGEGRGRDTGHRRPELATDFAAPRNPTEESIAAILAEVLGIDRVGIDDDFNELGGDSLLAIQVIARLRRSFGVELPLRALFEAPTVARLAVEVLAAQSRGAEPERLEHLLADLEDLSEEEVEALLAQDQLVEEQDA